MMNYFNTAPDFGEFSTEFYFDKQTIFHTLIVFFLGLLKVFLYLMNWVPSTLLEQPILVMAIVNFIKIMKLFF